MKPESMQPGARKCTFSSHDEGHFILYNKLEFYSRAKVAQNIIVCSLGGFAVEMGGSGGFGVFVDAQLGTSKGKAASLLFSP